MAEGVKITIVLVIRNEGRLVVFETFVSSETGASSGDHGVTIYNKPINYA